MMQIEEITGLIEKGIPGCQVEIKGDDSHFDAIIISELFAGKNMVQQHQLVYKSLGERIGAEIHALSMQTYTPEEWDKKLQLRVV